jgi:hypothetical protein
MPDSPYKLNTYVNDLIPSKKCAPVRTAWGLDHLIASHLSSTYSCLLHCLGQWICPLQERYPSFRPQYPCFQWRQAC